MMGTGLIKSVSILISLIVATSVYGQDSYQPTPTEDRLKSFSEKQTMIEEGIFKGLSFKNIGPTVFGGRVVDLDINPENPNEFYVAYASGGVWHTANRGQSFEPVFDHEATHTIGDIAVDWNASRIWIGTGEVNSSRSSYAGTGMYVSDDLGKTWKHAGLPESHHIGRILIDPQNSDKAIVAVLGHLYSTNSERGVYVTDDGGESWEQTLFVNDSTGAVDLVFDPSNSSVVYAATWERQRWAWHFKGSGKGSGIHKSTDGGQTWKLLSSASSGLPIGQGLGRIGLGIAGDGKTIYAFIDNQDRRLEPVEEETVVTKDMLRQISAADFLLLSDEDLGDFLAEHYFPKKYDAQTVKNMVKEKKIEPIDLVHYLEDANAELFDTPVVGASLFRSVDGGNKWIQTHDDYLDNIYFSYGYYFGCIAVNPQDASELYIAGVPILRSEDSGDNFESIGDGHVHVDHHIIWINPNNPNHIMTGNDGGLNVSYDKGENWDKLNSIPVGQFYTVAVDDAEPYNVYGGTQDNGVWVGPSTYRSGRSWTGYGKYQFEDLMGGDGMQVAISKDEDPIIYTGYQFGNYFKISNNRRDYITPSHELGERPLRWNWQTPISLSSFTDDLFFMASNKFHRSTDGGETFEAKSDDLTLGGKPGNVPYGTATSISESPLRFGRMIVGTDDGRVHLTDDAGETWEAIDETLPGNLWVSRVHCSPHNAEKIYVSLNGYRFDHFAPYLYVSLDAGKTWKEIGEDLPLEPINVVKEDPNNEGILYVGTDNGLYISLDDGVKFYCANNDGFPNVAVHDLVVQAREKELVLGTHGRSFYKVSLKEVYQLDDETMNKPIHILSAPLTYTYNEDWGELRWNWTYGNPRDAMISFWSAEAGEVTIEIKDDKGFTLSKQKHSCTKGLNSSEVSMVMEESYLQAAIRRGKRKAQRYSGLTASTDGNKYLIPGVYTIVLQKGTELIEQQLTMEDPEAEEGPPPQKKTP